MRQQAITIVGGGPAGLALGIELRHRGVPVTAWEAGHYPRHRVCGEFLSGLGWSVLGRLGLLERLVRAGASAATRVAFFRAAGACVSRRLPQPALCCSRWTLDAALASEFCRLGGVLRTGERWNGGWDSPGIVRATGRRVETGADAHGWRWFGVKAHARNVALTADLEMHFLRDGYVGLCRVDSGRVNVCGLVRWRRGSPVSARKWLRGAPGTLLEERLRCAEFLEDSWCAVAGLSWHLPDPCEAMGPEESGEMPECRVGDAWAVIPPLTGHGLSLALESAALAAEPLAAWSRGDVSWAEAVHSIGQAYRVAFARRFAWGRWLQGAVFRRWLFPALWWGLSRSDRLWRGIFQCTRGVRTPDGSDTRMVWRMMG